MTTANFGQQIFVMKPIFVEAIEFTGGVDSAARIVAWVIRGNGTADWYTGVGLFVDTLTGRMEVAPGDYVVRGVGGDFQPYAAETFLRSYEAV